MIKAAVVGVGYWGPNLVRNLAEARNVELKWLCDKKRSRLDVLGRRYPAVRCTTDFNEVLSDTQVDLVVICTPVNSHFKLASRALKAKRHVLLTKPMATTEAECKRLIELAEINRCVLMVDHTFVYHPAVQHLKKLIQSDELGRLLYYDSRRLNLGLYQPDVSVIFDLMPHDVSILTELVAEDPIEISVTAKSAAGLPQPDIAYLQLNYESDFIASIHASWLSPSKIRETIVTGTKKMAVYNDVDVVQKIKIFDKGVDSINPHDRESSYVDLIQYRQGDVLSPAIAATEALQIEVAHLVDCIEHGKVPQTDGKQGLRVVRILEYADRIARTQRCWHAIPRLDATTPIDATPRQRKGEIVV